MTILALLSFLLLFGYLGIMAHKYGIPDMVSDTYYQLGKRGWIFSVILSTASLLMMVALLDSGLGLQPAAIVAAAGCLLWCLSVKAWPTLLLTGIYAAYWVAIDIERLTGHTQARHPWYWAEVCCFGDVFVTWWAA